MARRLIPAAVIRNPRSARNARGRGPVLDLPTAEPADRATLRQALAAFRDDGVELLAVDGGDGTLREVLTVLLTLRWAPRVAVRAAGKINLIAGDVGAADPRRLHDLVAGGWGTETIERRPLLRLDRDGTPPLYGMFAGGGAFTRACDLANRHLHPRRIESSAAVATALAALLGRTLLTRRPHGEPMAVAVDGGTPVGGKHFLLLATTLERLVLGLWPFVSEGAGAINYLDIDAPPHRLGRALMPLALGHHRPWMRAAGYRSGNAFRVTIETENPIVLDGEPFAPGPDGRLTLSTGPVVEFVRP